MNNSNWETCELTDVADIISGRNQKEVESPDGKFPIYGSGGTFGRATEYLCEAGTTVIGRKGTINTPLLIQERFWNVDTAFGISPNDAIKSKLLYYFCLSFNFTTLDKSTTIPSLAKRDLLKIPLPLPPLNEQKRIVAKLEELFSELDAGVASLKQARTQLGIYRQSLLKQAFEGKLTAQWRRDHPELLESPEQLLTRIQQERETRYQQSLQTWQTAVEEWEAGGSLDRKPPKPKKTKIFLREKDKSPDWLPDTWADFNLSQIVVCLGQGWSPKCENFPASEGNWGVMKTTAIQPHEFLLDEQKALPPSLSPRPWLSLYAGDILITRAGPRTRCGIICRVPNNQPRTMLCDKAYRVSLVEDATSSIFMELLLNSPNFSRRIENLKTGINDSGVNITQTSFLQLPIAIPPQSEQQEIVRLLEEQFTAIEQNEREIEASLRRAEALRQSILKRAFSGQLVPQDPTDEPAAQLLARIQQERTEREAQAPKKRAKKKSASRKKTRGA